MTEQEHRNYDNVHHWIIRHYGKATDCISATCEKKAKRIEWALKKGFSYEKNIGNYMQLCASCHRKYDYTQEQRNKVSEALRKRVYTPELRENMSRGQKGRIIPKEVREKMAAGQKRAWLRGRKSPQRNQKTGKFLSN